jgi:hypothetical protein
VSHRGFPRGTATKSLTSTKKSARGQTSAQIGDVAQVRLSAGDTITLWGVLRGSIPGVPFHGANRWGQMPPQLGPVTLCTDDAVEGAEGLDAYSIHTRPEPSATVVGDDRTHAACRVGEQARCREATTQCTSKFAEWGYAPDEK